MRNKIMLKKTLILAVVLFLSCPSSVCAKDKSCWANAVRLPSLIWNEPETDPEPTEPTDPDPVDPEPTEPEPTPEEPDPEPTDPDPVTPEEPETPTPPSNPSENPTPSNPGNNNDAPSEPETLSSDARLDALEISVGELNPAFSSDVLEYTVELESDVQEIEVYATAWSYYASIYGTGLHELKVGSNPIEIEVYAEDGTVSVYKINVKVKEKPVVFLTYQQAKLGILNEVEEKIIPKGFKTEKIKIEDHEVNSFVNESGKIRLLYTLGQTDEQAFYMYSEKDGLFSKYRPMSFKTQDMYVIDIPEAEQTKQGLIFNQLEIGKDKVPGWNFRDTKLGGYILLKLMNQDGEVGLYVYNDEKKDLLAYPETEPLTYEDFQEWLGIEQETTPWLIYGAGAAIAVLVLAGAAVLLSKKKKKKKTSPRNRKYKTFSIIEDVKLVDDKKPFLEVETETDAKTEQNKDSEDNFWLND